MRLQMKYLRVGVVGAGVIAQGIHLPVLANMPGIRVEWLTDSDAGRGESVARAFGIPFARFVTEPRDLPACDIALLAIPLGPRSAYYEQFAERDIAVFAEKPFARNHCDHLRFMKPFAAHRIGCSYMRRGGANFRMLRRAVSECWFGALRRLLVSEGARATKTGVDDSYQDDSIEAGGGILVNLGCHAIDTAFFVTGARRYSLHSRNIVLDGRTDRKAQATFTLHDVGGRSGEDVHVDYTVSWLDRQENTLTFEFERATLVTPISPSSSVRLLGNDGQVAATIQARFGGETAIQAYCAVWRDFLASVQSAMPGAMSAAESEITALLIDELRAANGGAQCAS
jgi:predicted dehydrogenase